MNFFENDNIQTRHVLFEKFNSRKLQEQIVSNIVAASKILNDRARKGSANFLILSEKACEMIQKW
jgi:hypothetical protein